VVLSSKPRGRPRHLAAHSAAVCPGRTYIVDAVERVVVIVVSDPVPIIVIVGRVAVEGADPAMAIVGHAVECHTRRGLTMASDRQEPEIVIGFVRVSEHSRAPLTEQLNRRGPVADQIVRGCRDADVHGGSRAAPCDIAEQAPKLRRRKIAPA
jgi:hypothetical protein